MSGVAGLALLGLDSSHALRFCSVFNGDRDESGAARKGRIINAWAGPCSDDFTPSRSRHARVTDAVAHEYSIPLARSLGEALVGCDAALITAADPRVHLEIVRGAAAAAIPLFINKPLALTTESAREIFAIAKQGRFPVWSSSPHRFGAGLMAALAQHHLGPASRTVEIVGRIYGVPPVPPIFWYGVHLVEMAYAILGLGCQAVRAVADVAGHPAATLIEADWVNGRRVALSGSANSPGQWQVTVVTAKETVSFDPVGAQDTRMQELGQAILHMTDTGQAPVTEAEQMEMVRFMEAAEESRKSGSRVVL